MKNKLVWVSLCLSVISLLISSYLLIKSFDKNKIAQGQNCTETNLVNLKSQLLAIGSIGVRTRLGGNILTNPCLPENIKQKYNDFVEYSEERLAGQEKIDQKYKAFEVSNGSLTQTMYNQKEAEMLKMTNEISQKYPSAFKGIDDSIKEFLNSSL